MVKVRRIFKRHYISLQVGVFVPQLENKRLDANYTCQLLLVLLSFSASMQDWGEIGGMCLGAGGFAGLGWGSDTPSHWKYGTAKSHENTTDKVFLGQIKKVFEVSPNLRRIRCFHFREDANSGNNDARLTSSFHRDDGRHGETWRLFECVGLLRESSR